ARARGARRDPRRGAAVGPTRAEGGRERRTRPSRPRNAAGHARRVRARRRRRAEGWATWCTPCTLEMPTLEALWTQYRDRGLVVVGISVDRGAPRHLLDPYIAHLELTFPILLDPALETAAKWRITALPATFIVKPGGEVVGYAVGPREWNGA